MTARILAALADGGWWYLSELVRQGVVPRRPAALRALADLEAAGRIERRGVILPHSGAVRSRWRLK